MCRNLDLWFILFYSCAGQLGRLQRGGSKQHGRRRLLPSSGFRAGAAASTGQGWRRQLQLSWGGYSTWAEVAKAGEGEALPTTGQGRWWQGGCRG
jgi:hypothetical protein